MSVTAISATSPVPASLRRLADDIEAGHVDPAFGVVVLADRRNGTVSMTFVGEHRRYTEIMGLLSYATCHCFDMANSRP